MPDGAQQGVSSMPWMNLGEEIGEEFQDVQNWVPVACLKKDLGDGFRVFRPSGERTDERRASESAWKAPRDAKRREALLRAGLLPKVWTEAWRRAAVRVGLAEATSPRAERQIKVRIRALQAGERPQRWSAAWREAARRLGINTERRAA